MPHMLAQEHMGYVDALRYGTTLDSTTIGAAHSAIGSAPAILVLTATGTGVWSITSNMNVPANVIWMIPMGVTVNIASGVTLGVGLVLAWQNTWHTGPGTLNKSAVAIPMEITNIVCTTFTLSNAIPGVIWEINDGTGTSRPAIQMYVNQGNNAGVQISRNIGNANSTWGMNTVNTGEFQLVRPGGSPMVVVNNNGMFLGANVASGGPLLQLQLDSAAKPGTSTWSVVSDRRGKEVRGPYTQSLAFLKRLPRPQIGRYNGKGFTPTDGKDFVSYIAQDLEAVAPHLIERTQARLEEGDTDETELLLTNIGELHFVHHNALLELDARLTALEASGAQQAAEADATEAEEAPHTRRSARHPR